MTRAMNPGPLAATAVTASNNCSGNSATVPMQPSSSTIEAMASPGVPGSAATATTPAPTPTAKLGMIRKIRGSAPSP